MALRISGRAITSDRTPETAHLVPGPGGGAWALSWLPGWDLTREQAIDGMALDEMLSDPSAIDREWALEMAELRAESLGMGLEDVVVRLCARIIERDRMHGANQRQHGADQRQTEADRSDGEPTGRSPLGAAGAQRMWGYVRGKLPRWAGRMDGAGAAARGIIVAMLWARYWRRCANSSKR